ncbi:MAG: hypothetical protein IPM75_03020 [Candidatus Competibacteraceae bacterium]|nr:hypothetical protein [Candidatus Competibacteraceae bacterium]
MSVLPQAPVAASDPLWWEARFVALWNRAAGGAATAASAIYQRLARLYGESHRHYHTFEHIRRCLEEFDAVVALTDDPDHIEMALWFHDAIYAPGAPDNEQRSADLFQRCAEGGMDERFRQSVRELIMATAHRRAPVRRNDCFVVDIDLCSFGSPWETFERDGRRIRAEFAGVPDDRYYPNLLRFLRALQSRPTFFFTDYFQRCYEAIAHANTQRLVEELRARGYSLV